jgi:predicted lysophospholipase L1 biosynthesis ABC-type transport system permease subunit
LGSPKNSEEIEVIGVVADAKYQSLDEPAQPMAYYVHSQRFDYLNNFAVRVSGDPGPILPAIRQAIKDASRNLPIDEVATLADHVERSVAQQTLVARLAAFFGAVALLLACIGLYGLMSYAVARRTNEMGIRLALGAQPGAVRRMVLGEGLVLVTIGLVLGLAAAWAATRLLTGLLFGLSPGDPSTIATATVLLALVAAVAVYWPARRASRVDPLVALREE